MTRLPLADLEMTLALGALLAPPVQVELPPVPFVPVTSMAHVQRRAHSKTGRT